MSAKPQTAIRGVAFAGTINAVARLFAFAFHVAITAFYGLTGELDAYFIALNVVSLTFLVLGDGFDSIGVPSMVRALQTDGVERFREVAGSLFVLSAGVTLALAVLVGLLLPWAHYLAPGLRIEFVPLVAGNLLRLAPFALLYLPCRAAASILRSRRRFVAAASWEAVGAAGTLIAIVTLRHAPFGVAAATSVGAVAGAVSLAGFAGAVPRLSTSRFGPDLKGLFLGLMALLPIYGVAQLFRVADRAFASFLPEGAISAISYGQMLVLIPGAVLTLENVFMTPLAETEDRGPMLRRILHGILIISLPMAFFAAVFPGPMIAAAFERGRFDAVATRTTAEALQGFAIGLPAFLAWPVLYRVFLILRRTRTVLWLAIGALVLNCALNAVSLAFGLGVRGLALATTLSSYALVAGGLITLRPETGRLAGRETATVALQTAVAGALALGAAWVVPAPASAILNLAARVVVFLAAAAALLAVAPASGIREWRAIVVADLLRPWRRRS